MSVNKIILVGRLGQDPELRQTNGGQAEACEKYLAKGREVYIEGEIRSRKYDDKQGVEKTVVEVVARDVRFLGSKDTAGSAEPAGKAAKKSDDWGNDEISF